MFNILKSIIQSYFNRRLGTRKYFEKLFQRLEELMKEESFNDLDVVVNIIYQSKRLELV